MLKKQKAEFQVKCIISDAIAVISIIVAAICNLGFYRGTSAFFTACIGFVCAVAYQTVVYMLAKQHIGMDETVDERMKAYLQELKGATYKTYFVILLCFVFCLPLSLCIGRGSIYILAGSWFLHGTFLCEYKPFNEDVEYIEYGDSEKLPITVYTKVDYENVREMLRNVKRLWIVAVFAEGTWFIVQYKKKKNN